MFITYKDHLFWTNKSSKGIKKTYTKTAEWNLKKTHNQNNTKNKDRKTQSLVNNKIFQSITSIKNN